MFHRFQQALALRRYNKQRLNRISFLFQSGYYIFWQDQICKFTLANIKTIGFFKALFFTYHVPNRIPKKEELEHAVVKTGTFKHAVISESYCYLVFKQPKQYWAFRENYFKNIEFFNYPAIRPISCHDDLFYIVEPKVQGRSLTTEELPRLLAFLLKLFQLK